MRAPQNDNNVVIAGVKLTHPERVLYPDQGITKTSFGALLRTYLHWILPHLEGRPLTLVRCPEGQGKQCFYQRHTRERARAPIRSIAVREQGKTAHYLAVDSLPGLITLVQAKRHGKIFIDDLRNGRTAKKIGR